jgi:CDP-4-dehydro-6-deoxyglucose reductase
MLIIKPTIKTLSQEQFDAIACESILDSALNNNIIFEHSCKNGRCGVCKTHLIEGEVAEIRPQLALTEADRLENKILTCCCEAVTDIVIDSESQSALQGIAVKNFPSKISSIYLLSDDIIEVTLRLPPTASFLFLEGQYLNVSWNGAKRSYSMASSSINKEIVLLIKKVSKGIMSEYWFEKAKINDVVRIEGPLGTFFLRDGLEDLVFLATGTGIGPVKAILEKLNQLGSISTEHRKIYLFWGNRNSAEFVWDPKLTNINVQTHLVVSKPSKEWNGLTGYVQNIALDVLGKDISNCKVYACGSSMMIKSASEVLVKSGLVESNFYSDAFVQSY